MKIRRLVICLFVICGISATAAFQSCGRRAQTGRVSEPLLSSIDPSEVTQAYWLAARRVSVRSARSSVSLEQLRRKASTIKSSEDAKRVWSEMVQSYERAAGTNVECVEELKSIPRDRVDQIAVECVAELAEFLDLQTKLFQVSGVQSNEMVALFELVQAEGDAFDWNGPKGKEYERREIELAGRMKVTASNEGAAEKSRLSELSKKANKVATILSEKYGRVFPDLLGN
jgi:hypothetical protein